jgi:hypothetical protein
MDPEKLIAKFAAIGARAVVGAPLPQGWPRLDVGRDRHGEFFDIRPGPGEMLVVDVVPAARHLLLLARDPSGEKAKFLCGHDERHFFVAAVPGAHVKDVQSAQEALRPPEVAVELARTRLPARQALRRRNPVYHRQGEWFFLPVTVAEPPPAEIHRDEPLSRGRGSKPHRVAECFRRGGTAVLVHRRHAPTGIPVARFDALPAEVRNRPGWTRMVENPEVYARGWVRHADHATVTLRGWHRVLLNTEAAAKGAPAIAFLD